MKFIYLEIYGVIINSFSLIVFYFRMYELTLLGLYLFTVFLRLEVRRKPRHKIDFFIEEILVLLCGFGAARHYYIHYYYMTLKKLSSKI